MQPKIDILFVKVLSTDMESVLREMSQYLCEKGYVKETYEDAIIKREKAYPTGLEIPGAINVCIPHVDIEHVNRQALLIGVPNQCISFKKMDKREEDVAVELIFNLVINDPNGYVRFLSNLVVLFQDANFVKMAKEKDYQKLANAIEKCFPGKTEDNE